MKTVPLHGKKAAGRVALVDDEDYGLVMQYRWTVYEGTRSGRPAGPYVRAWFQSDGRSVAIRMHVVIMGRVGIDHINHNGLDNRRSNLRVATGQQNQYNARPRVNSSSAYKGVAWSKRRNCWRVRITIDGHQREIGAFADEIEAARAYDAAALKWFGEFACINFPLDGNAA